MFEALSQRIARNPLKTIGAWAVIALTGFLIAVIGVTGDGLFDRLSTDEPGVAGSESDRGSQILREQNQSGETITLLVSEVFPANSGIPDVVLRSNTEITQIPGVISVLDPYVLPEGLKNPAAATLVAQSDDGFLQIVELDPQAEPELRRQAQAAVTERLTQTGKELREVSPESIVLVGGNSLISKAVTDQVRTDLTTGEKIALPVALVIMVLVFGGFLAAALPMVGAIASIGAGLGTLYALSYPMTIDSSIVNVITLISIGLSIDYGLLIVSRFREEILRAQETESLNSTPRPSRRRNAKRRPVDPVVLEALIATLRTAGRTVAYSALTVAISISGLMLFTPEVLRAIGAAGLAIVLLAVLTALTLVPAIIVLTGRELGRPGVLNRIPLIRRLIRRTADVQTDEGVFSRLARRVQRKPWWVLATTVVVLLAMATPLLGMHLRNSGIGILPTDSPQRQFITILAAEYPAAASPDITVVTDITLDRAQDLAKQFEAQKNVENVTGPMQYGAYVTIGVDVIGTDPGSPEASQTVRQLREIGAKQDFPTWVTGQAAGQVDFIDALTDRMWKAIGIVVAATLILLFLMTGSLVLPIKALLTNVVSLAASLGVLTWAFQHGNLEGVLNFSSTGGLEVYVVALVIAFAFGLSMDYEVFLLARIKEFHDKGHDNNSAVQLGLQRSGRIITSAAAIIVVVFAGFVFGELLLIKEVGFALAFAVALDATIVRMLLVPATMTVLGEFNWWAPRFLKRLTKRFALTH